MLRRSLSLLTTVSRISLLPKSNLHVPNPICFSLDKDLPTPTMPTPLNKAVSADKDILLEEFKRAKSLDRILELSSTHLEVMNSKHIVACLDSVHSLKNNQEDDYSHLLENQTFQAVCTRLMNTSRFLEPQDLITSYKVLSSLGVRNNSYVMQTILKMFGAHLNNMSINQLTFLNFMLSRQRPNTLVDGLKMALPLVLQIQIDQQVDSDDMNEVVNALVMACRSKLKPAAIEKIISVIIQKSPVFSPSNAACIVFALLNLDSPVDGYKALINNSFDILSNNIETLSKKQILSIVRLCRFQRFYHSKFFFAATDNLISNKWELQSVYDMMNYFQKLKFSPSNLIDYVANMICTNSSIILNNSCYSPLNFLEFLTMTNHNFARAEEIAEILSTCEVQINKMFENSPHLIMKMLSCLAILGFFPKNLLSKTLNEDFLFKAWSNSKKHGRSYDFERNVLALNWGLEISGQKENFPLSIPFLKQISSAIYQRYADSYYPLKNFIENGLGGAQFLQTGIFTHDGHFIDHMLAMRNGNYPVSLATSGSLSNDGRNLKPIFIEDFILPNDTKIIAILVATAEQYNRDPEVLTGWFDLKAKHLTKKSYSTVVINLETWKSLPDREKIPYIMREIKQSIQADDNIRTSLF